MRILQIRFKNLNSLAGEWDIDLEHPAFTSDGIFAITGPTGAGKTTILDAICLGLYGRTPRLNKVAKSGNEIMSRQTGECFAEVTFATRAGRYRCHWSQHRARKRPGGELQAPKHEIADADSGEILEAKIRGVAEQIEVATGMDFDRFTRSMLLAQGGFAAFLQAAADERAPILEQITGTEIYSQLSVRVHELRSAERKKLDTLQAQLAGLQLLSPEDEQRLSTSLEQKTLQDVELNQQLVRKKQAVDWLDGIARIEGELKQVGHQQRDLQTRVEAFAPEQEKLRLANQALELAAEYAALTSIRREQESDRGNDSECRQLLPRREQAAKLAGEAMNAAIGRLEAEKTEQLAALPVIRKARELDLKIRGCDAPIELATGAIAEYEKFLEALRSKQHGDLGDLDNRRKDFNGLRQLLDDSSADEGLVEALAGIRQRFEALHVIHGQLESKIEGLTQADVQVMDASRLWQQQAEKREADTCDRDSKQRVLAQKQMQLKGLLEGRELSAWRRSVASLTARQTLLAEACITAGSISQSMLSLEQLGKRKIALLAEGAKVGRQLQVQIEKQVASEQQRDLLETQFSLLKKIEDLEEARHQLRDGEPCPLCGASEHPFAEGNIPAPDETRQRLAAVRSDVKVAADAVLTLQVAQARLGKELEQLAAGQKEHTETVAESRRQLIQACADLSVDGNVPELSEKLTRLQHENGTDLDRANRVVLSAEETEKELIELRELLEIAKEAVVKIERETQAAAHKKDIAEQLQQRLKKEAAVMQTQCETSLGQLQRDVQAFDIETLGIDNLDQVQHQLAVRREQWLLRQKQTTELNRQITALEIQTQHQTEQILQSGDELKKQQQLRDGLLRDRQALRCQRQQVFADKSPDDEESRLAAAIELADKTLEATRQQLNAANQDLSQLTSRIQELAKSIATRGREQNSMEQTFLLRFEGAGFASEDSFKAASLPEGERKTLAQQSQILTDENIKLSSKARDSSARLEAERLKRIADQPRGELESALTTLAATLKELQQEIGGVRQKLEDNQKIKQMQQDRVQAIAAQKRECSRWDLLHELIGSADGKKYRNFAQGLTFEMMVGHANRQLQKMTDRYLLVRDDVQALELNVIDNYQAGEIRSTKNLSGGESFIVSLSLALGLSHMASKNVRVDSLFLDEGFGTLDEDALDTALETLSGLQQDGKLIGVISHVPALKERIGTQIQVTPKTGGRSEISGPGCERVGIKVEA